MARGSPIAVASQQQGGRKSNRQFGACGPLTPVDLRLVRDQCQRALEPSADPLSVVKTLIQVGDLDHYRFEFASNWARGRGEYCALATGMVMHTLDAQLVQPHAMSVQGSDTLRIRIASEGSGYYKHPCGEVVEIRGPCALIIIEPTDMPPAEAVLEDYNRAVHVYADRKALMTMYQGGEAELPPVLRSFLEGSLTRTFVRRLPLKPGLLRCLEDVHNCVHDGRTRWLFMQSKAVEIFCHAFDALHYDDRFGSTDASMITSRGVLRAQRMLMEKFASPPSLEALARQVGLSRSGLCNGFRQILGQSVFDYILDLRMQEALALLNKRDSSITQVAYAVGYNHVSSFSVAVQRRFGVTPRDLRRQAGASSGLPTQVTSPR